MITLYYFICIECKQEISKMMEYDDIPSFLSENSCECGGILKKVMGVAGVHFKGSGYTKKMA